MMISKTSQAKLKSLSLKSLKLMANLKQNRMLAATTPMHHLAAARLE